MVRLSGLGKQTTVYCDKTRQVIMDLQEVMIIPSEISLPWYRR